MPGFRIAIEQHCVEHCLYTCYLQSLDQLSEVQTTPVRQSTLREARAKNVEQSIHLPNKP